MNRKERRRAAAIARQGRKGAAEDVCEDCGGSIHSPNLELLTPEERADFERWLSERGRLRLTEEHDAWLDTIGERLE